jgi:hypothetical protein
MKKTTMLILPFLVLTTPFLHFLGDNSYCLLCPEIVVIFIGIIVINLLCILAMTVSKHILYGFLISLLLAFFIDTTFAWNSYILIGLVVSFFVLSLAFKEKFYFTVTAVFTVFFIITVAQLPQFSGSYNIRFKGTMPQADNNALPRIIHIILDEHIGIEGVPTDTDQGKDLKNNLIQFYQDYGFHVFGGAYSHYETTADSLSNMLNFSAKDKKKSLITVTKDWRGKERNEISNNDYFKILYQSGYRLNVLETSYMGFCLNGSVNIENCFEYPATGISAVTHLNEPLFYKIKVILAQYLRKSHNYKTIRSVYQQTVQPTIETYGLVLPLWTWDRELEKKIWMPSFKSLHVMDGLWEDIVSMPPGNVLFAHIFFPHIPLIVNADGSIRNPIRELKPSGSDRSRIWKESYRAYFLQLQYLYGRLNDLFQQMQKAGIYNSSIIILHGDHGSRKSMTSLDHKNYKILTERDILDGFSTLFALKLPNGHGNYSTSRQPLEELLADFVSVNTGAKVPVSIQSEPYVYLYSKAQEKLVYFPWPDH